VQDSVLIARSNRLAPPLRRSDTMQAKPFESWKVVLNCGACGACPAVEITPEWVTIGEEANTVRLTHAQWNDLVSRIRTGELPHID
jgi:hypothetical protein